MDNPNLGRGSFIYMAVLVVINLVVLLALSFIDVDTVLNTA